MEIILSSYLSLFLAVLFLTAFVKIITTLSICLYGLGFRGLNTGIVIFALAFVLSLIVVSPQLDSVGGLQAFFDKTRYQEIKEVFVPFLEENSDSEILQGFRDLSHKISKKGKAADKNRAAGSVSDTGKSKHLVAMDNDSEFFVLVAAFLISEVKKAFYVGVIVLIPFLVIDLIVTNLLMALSITQISASVVSFPLKLLLFVAVDGWKLLSNQLLEAYIK